MMLCTRNKPDCEPTDGVFVQHCTAVDKVLVSLVEDISYDISG
jgi:hypothetical protein